MKFLFPVIGYICGAIPFGYIFVKSKGNDIRNFGSGNIGATNVFRFNKKLGLLTAVLDVSKSLIPTLFALKFCGFLIASLTGFMAILGHATTPFLKFRGGKSVSTMFGAYIILTPFPFLISFLTFFLVILITRIVSVGSMSAVLALVIVTGILKYPLYFKILTLFVFFLIVFLHRENIKRLLKGEESKFRG